MSSGEGAGVVKTKKADPGVRLCLVLVSSDQLSSFAPSAALTSSIEAMPSMREYMPLA